MGRHSHDFIQPRYLLATLRDDTKGKAYSHLPAVLDPRDGRYSRRVRQGGAAVGSAEGGGREAVKNTVTKNPGPFGPSQARHVGAYEQTKAPYSGAFTVEARGIEPTIASVANVGTVVYGRKIAAFRPVPPSPTTDERRYRRYRRAQTGHNPATHFETPVFLIQRRRYIQFAFRNMYTQLTKITETFQ